MNTQDRIADALERIASALESRNQRRQHARKNETSVFDMPMDEMEFRVRNIAPTFNGRNVTMDEIMSACDFKNATRGQRQIMGLVLERCGFKQKRTAQQRYYIAP